MNDSRWSSISANTNSAYRNFNVTWKQANGSLLEGEMEAAIKQVKITNRLVNKLTHSNDYNRRGPFLNRCPGG